MIRSNVPRRSKLRTAKPHTLPNDLAERFLELQQLRKKVQELEKLSANDYQHSASSAGANPVGRPK
jgi:hypothetical protein